MTVRIEDDCFQPAEEQAKHKEDADVAFGVLFVWSYFSRQAACARDYERRMRHDEIRANHAGH